MVTLWKGSDIAQKGTCLEEVWFKLFHISGAGSKVLWQLGKSCGENRLSGTFEQDWHLFEGTPLVTKKDAVHAAYNNEQLAQQWQKLSAKGVGLLHPQSRPLLEAPHQEQGNERPAILCYWGTISQAFEAPTIGIIGARDADPYVLEVTEKLSYDLATEGKTILSGYARGVDTYAHAGALNAEGQTAAVLPHGIAELFSEQHDTPMLKSRLLTHLRNPSERAGLLFLSQFYPYSRWKPQRYIMRNHTICMLSQKVIVMNAIDQYSGSYQTGRAACRLNIPLYVFMPKEKSVQNEGNRLLSTYYNAQPLNEDELLSTLAT